ncbi:MAG TPA: 4'-phosphopantetheinyl transferase superfamily protein [Pyrinomonadaceae bacterium]|nr:4'-phosphopantetheinyl transferase superfamily protein [Pyrinomonadaceae bacterium]
MANQLTLGVKDVHVWRASLDQTPAIVEQLRQLLSADERIRADRFHFENDRQHFVVGRGCLRMLLSRYLEIPPGEIQFSYGAQGKPQLATANAQLHPFHFNLAHSGTLALYAFTRVGEIGVDLERIRPEFTGDDIAKRFFSPGEVACLNELSRELRHEAFFNCWTRKEAFIKAIGMGLSLSLDQFDVTLGPAEPAELLRTRWDEKEAARWSLKALDVGPGYVAAVAVAGRDWQLTFLDVDKVTIEQVGKGSLPR